MFRTTTRLFVTKCYYELLGVPRDAPPDIIKSAYYKLAKVHHPDQQQDLSKSNKFSEFSEAYATLMDEEKRYDYDLSQGYLNAMDVDRMEEMKTRLGSRYGESYPAAKEILETVKNIDKSLGEEVLKDHWFAPKAVFGAVFRRKNRGREQKQEEETGKLLDDVRIFRQVTLLCLGFGFVVSYNATVYFIERYVFPVTPQHTINQSAHSPRNDL